MRRTKQIFQASALFLVTSLASSGLWAQLLKEPHQYELDFEEYVWKEQQIVIPPYPKDENLLEFRIDAPDSRYSYFIDTESLSIGEQDSVVRYTLVLKLSSGNRSITYEGINCSNKEYKIYAFGGRNNGMRPVTRPKWQQIRFSGNNLYRGELWEFYLCTVYGTPRRTKEEILDAIRYPLEDPEDREYREFF